jgi:DNA-binding NarL/FixJ family response regulator
MHEPCGTTTAFGGCDVEKLMSRVLVIDPHPLVRAGLVATVRTEPDLEVIAEVGTAIDALEVIRQHHVDIAILPVMMPKSNGLSLAAELLENQRELRILAFCALEHPVLITATLRRRSRR